MRRLIALCLVLAIVSVPVACTGADRVSPAGTAGPQVAEPSAAAESGAQPTATDAQDVPDPTAQTYAKGFAGVWDTTWGTMVLTVTTTTVTGTYEYHEGRIEAVLSSDGQTMEGTWAEAPSYEAPEEAGRIVFSLSEDGNSIEGYWWYGEDEEGGEWTGTRLGSAPPQEPTSEEEATATPGATGPGGPGLTLSSNPDNELLFYVTREDGDRAYYYGLEDEAGMHLSHIVVDDGSGEPVAIIYDGRLLPVQWILPDMTIAIYPHPEAESAPAEGTWFDPHQAFHVIIGAEEETLNADIYPGNLMQLLDDLEAATGQRFEGARGFLATHDVTFEELTEIANQPGPEQPFYIAAAAGFGAASAALGIERAASGVATVPRLRGLAAPHLVIFGEVIKVGAGAAGGILADMLGHSLDPGDGPAVGVLLCRGAAKYGVCHYVFFHASRLGECISFCQTSLGCFTDICMPMDISAEMAMNMRSGF